MVSNTEIDDVKDKFRVKTIEKFTLQIDDNILKKQEAKTTCKPDGATKVIQETFKSRLCEDKDFRLKVLVWICLCWSFVVLGWVMGQLGPSLLDLQEISHSSLEAASLFVTSTFIGYLTGSVINLAIFERMDAYLILVVGLFIMASSSAAIPFCSIYEIMVVIHVVKGIGGGILDSAGNALLMLKFRDEKSARSYLQTLHFTFAIGGILSPIATAPFLMLSSDSENNITALINITNTSHCCLHEETTVISQPLTNYYSQNTTISDHRQQSVLYKAYLISASLCVLAAIPFSLLSFNSRVKSKINKNLKDDNILQRKLPRSLKCLILAFMCLFLGIENGMEDTYFGFFATFTVKQYGWTKTRGSYAASLYWAAYAFGRFCAIFIVPYIKPSTLLRIYSIMLLLCVIGLFVSTFLTFHTGVWIFSPIIGFSISVFFPAIFLLTEEDFMSVTGRVASLLMFSASLGSMVNPIIIGYLMDNLNPIWFIYISLGQSATALCMAWIATFLSWYVKRLNTECQNEIYVKDEEMQKLNDRP